MSNSYLTTMYESIIAQQYIFLVEKLYLPFLLQKYTWKMHLPAPSAPVRHNYLMDSNIHLIDFSQKTVVYVERIIFV